MSVEGNGHRFGNFNNYYSFHPSNCRTAAVPNGIYEFMWTNLDKPSHFYICDIGCNSGDLSLAVLQQAKNELSKYGVRCYLLGIDLDPDLIARARTKYCSSTTSDDLGLADVEFQAIDVLSNPDFASDYYRKHNITGFSMICAFSITMWIHLNHHDHGMLEFLRLLAQHSLDGIIIEPQKWKSYKNAVTRCRKLGMAKPLYFDAITIRNDVDTIICRTLRETYGFDYVPQQKVDSSNSSTAVDLSQDIWGRSGKFALRL